MKLDFLTNQIILVTGGTGSFGQGFIKYLLANSKARKIIVFSRDELKQSRMEEEIKDKSRRLRFFLGDVRDLPRLERALNGVDIVVHAAALKQVPTLEYNPYEAIKTNILGSQNVIEASIDQRVKKVLLVSTDKAVQPINLYGSTKLCAEKLFVDGNYYAGGKMKFSCVRYGNVINSRGSIVETLLRTKGVKKVNITDKEMTRFWITLDQSFNLVTYALENMRGGEIFIPKIPSMKLVDLFDCLAPGAKQQVIGVRPGEKLHEVLLTKEEARHAFELEDCYAILPEHKNNFDMSARYKDYEERGKKLPIDFSYYSHTNTQWLTKENFKKIINKIKIE